jgi:diguanylate cyclase (GGDEF)-like protein
MTPQQAILGLGTVTLSGCGAGLVLIHGSNPLLKGLNWAGGALLLGGAAAGLMIAPELFPVLEPAANLCILLAFLCCYRADQYLIGLEVRREFLGISLIWIEVLAAILQSVHLLSSRAGLVVLSALVATQLETTARLISRNARTGARQATRFTVGLMRFLAVANILRGGLAFCSMLTTSRWAENINLFTYGLFVAAAIALAFAFFWRTTTKLSLQLEHMASTDPLTRVYNRRVFLNWCENEQTRTQRSGIPFSILMVDFDHFKKINDTFGHHVGDTVLVAAVERIQDSIRGIDILCRWGGEEFAVLLPNATEAATLIVAERIRQNIRAIKSADVRFADPGFARLELSASIGTATFSVSDDHFERMLQRADAALYEAKRAGRNRVIRSTYPAKDFNPETSSLVLEAT